MNKIKEFFAENIEFHSGSWYLRYAVWFILMVGIGLGIGFGLNKFEDWSFDLIVGD